MRGDPPLPRSRRAWPLVALPALLTLPPAVSLLLLATLVAARVGIRAIAAARIRTAERAPLGPDALVLGRDADGRRTTLSPPQLAAHALILGASGSGKTTTLLSLLTDRVRSGLPVVAIDLKGSPTVREALATAAGESGRPLRVWSLDGTEHWNPLAHGNATELKDKLISTERFTEPHYQRAAERYVQLALGVLVAPPRAGPVALSDVVAAMDPARLARLASGLPPAQAEHLRSYLAGLSTDQASAIRGLGARLAIMAESHVGPRLEPAAGREIDLERALAGEEVVLFSLNSARYGKLAAQLGTLAIQDLTAATGRRLDGSRREQVMVGIDEFSALGADHVIALLARGREAGVTVALATQELADLDRAGRGLRDQVLGNTAAKIIHRQDVPASARLAAQVAGSERAWETSYRFGDTPLEQFGARRGTMRLVDRHRVEPDTIMSLETGQGLVVTKVPRADARVVRIDPPRGGERDRGRGWPSRTRAGPARDGPVR